jgi:hypothetical protein
MPLEDITYEELFESQDGQVGPNEDSEYIYSLEGSDDATEIKQKLLAITPETVNDVDGNPMSRDGGSIERMAAGLYVGRVRYAKNATATLNIPPLGSAGYSFSTSGGSQHITQSRQTVKRYPESGSAAAPNFNGMIGVSGTAPSTSEPVGTGESKIVPGELSAAGCDIETPMYEWEEPHILSDEQVTPEYRVLCAELTGAVNNGSFRGFAAGEVLFCGARGSRRADGKWEVSFTFRALPNVTDGKLLGEDYKAGDITIETKRGWDYVWIYYGPSQVTVDGNPYTTTKPVGAYAERVRPYADLGQLDLPDPS